MLWDSHSQRLEIAESKICKGAYSAFWVPCRGMTTLYALTDQSDPWVPIKKFEQSNFFLYWTLGKLFLQKIFLNKCIMEFDNTRA